MKPSASSTTKTTVAVVGSGLGGLTAACTLAARGYAVTVFEANPWIGGKAAVLEDRGFRFDMGPTILTVPSVLRRVFQEAKLRMEDHLDLIECDPQWRCFFEGGSTLDLHRDIERTAAVAESRRAGDGEGYRKFLKFSAELEDISQRFFFWKSVGSIKDTFDFKSSFKAGTLSDVLRLKPGRTVASTIRGYVKDHGTAQMLDHFTQYVGSAPDSSPAVLCSIAHMQTGEGIWYPRGGTRAVPVALQALAERLGVRFRVNTPVKRLLIEQRRVVGVDLGEQGQVRCDAVISNMDSLRTFDELVGGALGRKTLSKERRDPACSGVVLYLGLDRAYDHLAHHNFVFSKDPEAEFEDIYRKGEPAEDPTAYVCAPARSEANVAPPGGEALYVLVHTPYLRPHHDWRAMLPHYRRTIIDKLARTAGMEDLERRIVVEHVLTPQDIHERYRVLQGAIYGLASHGRFFGAFKPANRRRELPGLYLAGGAAHPGPGMPMVMMSGWIAADALDQDHHQTGAAAV